MQRRAMEMTELPEEVLEHILERRHLGFTDVVNFSLTCKRLYKIIGSNNKLWRRKFFQRWPRLKGPYEDMGKAQGQSINWKEAVQASVVGRRTLLHRISMMSSENYKKHDLSYHELSGFDKLFSPEEGAHPLAYHFLVDELMSLLEQPEISSNLTHRHYALKVLRYLKQCYLKGEWERFTSLPGKQQTMERGATIMAQWNQPEKDVLYSEVAEVLDSIAEDAKEVLREDCPSHPLFSTPPEQFTLWKNNIIDDNQWSVPETREAIGAMCKVLFDKLGFHATSEMYDNPEHSFIDHVLHHRKGIPITLSIIFESVARRLGVRCEPVNFPSHFLLRWKERYTTTDGKPTENFYIDVFNHGHFLTKRNCPRVNGESRCPFQEFHVQEVASTVEVIKAMLAILEIAMRQHVDLNSRSARLRSALELQYLLDPYNINTVFYLARMYRFHQMELTDILKMLENIQKNVELVVRAQTNLITETWKMLKTATLPPMYTEVKQRSSNLKFAVGLIMRHVNEHYVCVIIGWDPCYREQQEPWRTEMPEVEAVEDSYYMPFYYVLLEDGTTRYVPQENLSISTRPQWINHCDIGRHFCRFDKTHYVPNKEKFSEYPTDGEALRKLLLHTYGVMVPPITTE